MNPAPDDPEEQLREPDRRFRLGVIVVTVTGAAWRLVMLISKWNAPLAFSDAWYYSIQAVNNAHGRWFKEASGPFQFWGVIPGAEHPPLTSVVITPASLLSHPEFWQRATMTLLGVAMIPAVAIVARRIGGRRMGVIAGALAAVYPNLWLSDSLVMSETITRLLVLLVLALALRHLDRFDVRSAVLLGAAIGLAGYARSELLLYAPLLALVGVHTRPWREWAKRAALVIGVAGAVVAPWIVFNTSRFDTLVLMSTNEGNTLLGANCPPTYAGPAMGGWILNCLADGPDRPGENTAERSARRRHEALAFAKAHVRRLPVVVVVRVLRAADLFRLHENVRADLGEEQPRWGIWAGIVSWWLLAPLAALGIWRMRRGVRYVLLVPVIGVLAVTMVFYGSHRLRAPLEPVVVIAAASTLASMTRLRARATGAAYE